MSADGSRVPPALSGSSMIDYHTHAHRGRPAAAVSEYLDRAAHIGLREIGLTDHLSLWSSPYFTRRHRELCEARDQATDSVVVRVAVEVDYVPGREDQLRRALADFDFDYVTATVRFGDEWRLDAGTDQLASRIREYYESMQAGAASGVFDIVAHFDLAGQLGLAPMPELRPLIGRTLDALRDSGVAIEVSTAGLRNRAGSITPSVELLRDIRARHIPIVLSSGAHAPEEVGYGFPGALALLRDLGFVHLASFAGRKFRPMSFAA